MTPLPLATISVGVRVGTLMVVPRHRASSWFPTGPRDAHMYRKPKQGNWSDAACVQALLESGRLNNVNFTNQTWQVTQHGPMLMAPWLAVS